MPQYISAPTLPEISTTMGFLRYTACTHRKAYSQTEPDQGELPALVSELTAESELRSSPVRDVRTFCSLKAFQIPAE